MGEMISLLKVQLMSLFGINKFIHKKRKGKQAKIGVVILLLLIVAGLFGGYVYYYSKSYLTNSIYPGDEGKRVEKFYSLIFSGLFIFLLLTSLFNVLGGFYKSKDMELVLSFPVKKIYVVISKFVRILVFGTIISVFIFAFSYLAVLKVDIKESYNIALIFLSLIFSNLISTSLGFLIGTLILYVCSFFRAKSFWQIFFVLALFLVLMFLPKAFGKGYGYIFYKLQNFAKYIQSNGTGFCIYLVISIISIVITVILTNLVFLGVRNAVSKVKHSKKIKANKTNSPFASEVKRNLKCFFSSASFSINSLIGPILTVMLGTALISCKGENLLTDASPIGLILFTILFIMFIVLTTLFIGMGAPSAVAISIEGKTLWILRSSPIKARTIIFAKFLLCALPSFISLTYTMIMFNVFVVGKINAVALVYSIVVGIGLPVMISSWGLIINLLLPSLDWESENQVVKRSASVAVFVGVTFAFSFIQGLYSYFYFKIKGESINAFIELFKGQAIFTIIITSVLAVLGVILLFTFGVKKFKKISG
ncbi:MAG TPA: hypothetical protein DDY82_04425 [Clostridiales bacterium]|nr:hypothetical protein [Clostridiales bacterium]